VRTQNYAIKRYVKLARGWRYCLPAISANNKLKPGVAVIDSREEAYTKIHSDFFIRIKGRWVSVGTTWQQALAKQAELEAKRDYQRKERR
jgi:hypothetical protein